MITQQQQRDEVVRQRTCIPATHVCCLTPPPLAFYASSPHPSHSICLQVFELYSNNRSLLELEYFGEVGTGLGPTLEFFTLLSHDLQKRNLKMWRHEEPAAEDAPEDRCRGGVVGSQLVGETGCQLSRQGGAALKSKYLFPRA